jgi:hypothetical protein
LGFSIYGLAPLLIGVSLVTVLSTLHFDAKSTGTSNKNNNHLDINAAYKYIIDRYNPNYGLVSENEHIDKYWLWSDNILAAQVLEEYDHDVSENISKTIKRYIQKYNIGLQSAWTVLIDPVLISQGQASFNAPTSKNFNDNIWYSDYSGNNELQCSDYANISFLKSIYFYKINKTKDSKQCYDQGMNMFDGKGFKDKSFISDGFRYSTYKAALWKIANSITGFGKTHEPANIMGKLQNVNTGGIYTHYDANLASYGYTNVETTSLTIMAYQPQ